MCVVCQASCHDPDLAFFVENNRAMRLLATTTRNVSRAFLRRVCDGLFVAVPVLTVLLCAWVVVRADHKLRGNILQQAVLVARAIDERHLLALTGTDSDLESPHYRTLRNALAGVRAATPKCRFAYLMGRRSAPGDPVRGADLQVFFFADSEPVDSAGYSPPGEPFAEVSAELRRVFESQVALVEGPVSDRWGTWISALVPIVNPQNGRLAAVLGMDIDAADWRWCVATECVLPLGLLIILAVSLVTVIVAACPAWSESERERRAEALRDEPSPVLHRLLFPLSLLFALLLLFMAATLYRQHSLYLARELEADLADIRDDMDVVVAQQAAGLESTLRPIVANADLVAALRRRDVDQLEAIGQPVFEALRRESKVTHFYFLDGQRTCLLRVHRPEKSGDMINRSTALQAERTGKMAAGLELGRLGTLTLRVVAPVRQAGVPVGYVELGKEIEDVLKTIHMRTELQLAVVLRKRYLDRESWQDGMRMLGREPRWDSLKNGVLAYASHESMTNVLAQVADEISGSVAHEMRAWRVSCGDKKLRVTALSLQDAGEREVGDLVVVRDVSGEQSEFVRMLVGATAVGVMLLALLLSTTYVLLRRTDARIRGQQQTLKQSEARYARLAEQSRTVTWEIDPDGLYTYVSDVVERVLGYRAEELVGKLHFYDLHPEKGREEFKRLAFEVFDRRGTFHNLVNPIVHRDGHLVWVSTNGVPFMDEDDTFRGFRGGDLDITEQKQAEDVLRQTTANLKAMAERLQSIREEERAALARELHDSLGQQLTAFALQVELIAMDAQPHVRTNAPLAAFYDRIVAILPQVEHLTEQTQKICSSLRPCVLDDLGLVSAIEWQVENAAKLAGLRYELALPEGEPVLGREVSLALFRIVQEALTNVFRHADATCLRVGLHADADGWVLEVADDGKGFLPDSVSGTSALGLLGMRERVGVFGGQVEVLSEPGKGTLVRVTVPKDASDAGAQQEGGA